MILTLSQTSQRRSDLFDCCFVPLHHGRVCLSGVFVPLHHCRVCSFRVCYVGERLLTQGAYECNSSITGQLYMAYCNESSPANKDCEYFTKHEVGMRPGFPGLSSGVFYGKLLLKSSSLLQLIINPLKNCI